jgi:hypothetical protein
VASARDPTSQLDFARAHGGPHQGAPCPSMLEAIETNNYLILTIQEGGV